MACAKQRIRRCVPKGWNVPPVARAKKKAAKKKLKKACSESPARVAARKASKKKGRVASPRAKLKNAAKTRSKATSAAANRGAVQASARSRAERRIVVWARNAMQARGFGREDVTVEPIVGTKTMEVAVQIARRDGSKRSLVAIVDAAYHVFIDMLGERFDGQGRVLELRDRAGIYVKNWRKAIKAKKQTAKRKVVSKQRELINQSYLKDYVERALEPVGSMRGFDAHLDAYSGNRKIRIVVQGPSDPHLHKSTQTVLDKAAALVTKDIAPKFGGLPSPEWNPYDVRWAVAGTWPEAIKKWKDAAKKTDKPARVQAAPARIRAARVERESGKALAQVERDDRIREENRLAAQEKARARHEKEGAAELVKELKTLKTAARKIEKMIAQLAKGDGDLQKINRAIDNLYGRVDKRGIDRESAYAIIEPLSAKASEASDAGDKQRRADRERGSSDLARKHREQQRGMSSYEKELAAMRAQTASDRAKREALAVWEEKDRREETAAETSARESREREEGLR